MRRKPYRESRQPPKPPPLKKSTAKVYPTKVKKWIRTEIPGYDPYEQAEGYTFDAHAACYAIEFFHRRLRHAKGTKAREPFVLEPWQQAVVGNLWGWRKKGSRIRRYRRAFLEVARKNGKTPMAAGLVLLLLMEDGEFGAEIYGAATEYKQASLVFEHARMMVLMDEEMSERAQIFKGQSKAIQLGEDWGFSTYRPIAADADSAQGFNTHGAVVDEVHTQPNRLLVDALETSTAARKQPLIVYITTSDYERPDSICNELEEYAIKVRQNIIHDPEFFPGVWKADRSDDWHDEEVWKKANPNLGVSVDLDYLRRAHQKACEIPTFENTFKRLHLNMRTEQDVRWINMDVWDECGAQPVRPEDLYNRECYAGLDLASISDSNAYVLVFPDQDGGFTCLCWFWVPEGTVRGRKDKTPYVDFVARGEITATPGDEVHYDLLRHEIAQINKKYRVKEIAVDRLYQGAQLSQELSMKDGFKVVQFPQTHYAMSAPCAELENLLIARKLRHGGNRVLRWMASNAVADISKEGNVKPDRSSSTQKIDGIVALLMGLGRAILNTKPSFAYNKDRGFVQL